MSTAMTNFKTNRRSFLTQSAAHGTALLLGLQFNGNVLAAVSAASNNAKEPSAHDARLNVWVRVSDTGQITIQCPTTEMGQGIFTSLPLLVAEELDADWNQVAVEQAPASPAFANPAHFKTQGVGGSRSMRGYWLPMRLAGAQARRTLLALAATHWKVNAAELATSRGKVIHPASQRMLSYGEIVALGLPFPELPAVTQAELKPRAQWRLIGKDVPRIDVPSKVNGTAKFGIDVQLPGMLYASILFPPAIAYPHPQFAPDIGITAKQIDDREALAIEGVLRVIPLNHGVAVVGNDYWATVKGKRALKVAWNASPQGVENYSSESVLKEFSAIARDPARKGTTRTVGDAAKAFNAAARIIEAQYTNEHVYHSAMEPMNATASVKGDQVDLWAPTQGQLWAQEVAAKAAGTTIDKVRVHTMLIGGGFGLKTEQLANYQAVFLSTQMQQPVKVIWSREDDLKNGAFRPAVAQQLKAAITAEGKLDAWQVRLVADSVTQRARKFQWEGTKGYDVVVMSGAATTYDIPNKHHEYIHEARGVPVGYWNANGAGWTNFAAESFIDELAMAQGKDAVAYRLELLHKSPRGRAVVQAVAKMCGWSNAQRTANRGLGIAYYDGGEWNAHAAHAAEVSVDRSTGQITVHKIWVAVEPGISVQPKHLKQQVETGVLFGLGTALRERISLENGQVQQSNLYDYLVTRIGEVPDIDIQILDLTSELSGGGQVGVAPVSAAIANAVAALTGKRIRHLPMLPEHVKALL